LWLGPTNFWDNTHTDAEHFRFFFNRLSKPLVLISGGFSPEQPGARVAKQSSD